MKASKRFFSNKKCEHFACHNIKNEKVFNCIFCYCPLYPLGEECGGDFTYTKKGVKDCHRCNLPHLKTGYEYIQSKIDKVTELVKKAT